MTGKLWPGAETFCFDIPYRHEHTLGDVKYVWELNKLQFLQPLAADFAMNGNRASLATVEAAIASWADANPPFRGVAWADTMSTAVRAMSLLVAASFCGEALAPATGERLRGMLRMHAAFGEQFPSLHSSANNHLIGELTAGCLVAVGLDAEREVWNCPAWEPLMAEALKQIHPDGIGAEQSPSYAGFVIECLLVVGVVARAQGGDLPAAVRDRLARFAEAIFWMSNGDGIVPEIGDNDEGTVLALRCPEPHYPASVARAAAGFLGLTAPADFELPATLHDLVLPPARHGGALLHGVRTFATGGLTVVRDTARDVPYVLTFDHGPLGYLSIAAHGHADALAITLSVDGAAVLVDPGTYLYHSGGAWRDWFRGTPAHSTLNIRRRDQSTIAGTFNWSQKADAQLDEANTSAVGWSVRASHDGYLKPFGVRHERTVASDRQGIVIRDRLVGASAPVGDVEIVFQLAPGLAAKVDGNVVSIACAGRRIAQLAFSTGGDITTSGGGEIGEGGWVSERFGTKVPALRVAWRGVLPLAGLETVIRIDGAFERGQSN